MASRENSNTNGSDVTSAMSKRDFEHELSKVWFDSNGLMLENQGIGNDASDSRTKPPMPMSDLMLRAFIQQQCRNLEDSFEKRINAVMPAAAAYFIMCQEARQQGKEMPQFVSRDFGLPETSARVELRTRVDEVGMPQESSGAEKHISADSTGYGRTASNVHHKMGEESDEEDGVKYAKKKKSSRRLGARSETGSKGTNKTQGSDASVQFAPFRKAGWHVSKSTHDYFDHTHLDRVLDHANWEMNELDKGDTSHSWYELAFRRKMGEKSPIHDLIHRLGFGHIVPSQSPENHLTDIVYSSWFAVLAATVVVANCIFSAWQADQAVKKSLQEPPEEMPHWWSQVDIGFAIFFGIEILCRLFALRGWFFVAQETWKWNCFDLALVITSAVTLCLGNSNIAFFRILRLFRVARIARVVRVVKAFMELRKLLFAVMACTASLFWAICFIFLVMFLFSLFIMQGVSSEVSAMHIDHEKMDDRVVKESQLMFNGMFSCYKTLWIVAFGDDWVRPHDVLVELAPMYTFIMPVFVLFVNIGVMNIVIGVFAEAAAGCKDHDLISQEEIRAAEDFVADMISLAKEFAPKEATNGGGMIKWDDFKHYFWKEEVQAYLSSQNLDASHASLIYELCDRNHDHSLDLREFVLGLLRLRGESKSLDMKILLHAVSALGQDIECLRHVMRGFSHGTGSFDS